MIMSYLLTRSLVLCFKASSGTSVIFISDEPGTPLIMYGVSELIDAGEDAGTSAGAGVNWFPILNGNLLGWNAKGGGKAFTLILLCKGLGRWKIALFIGRSVKFVGMNGLMKIPLFLGKAGTGIVSIAGWIVGDSLVSVLRFGWVLGK